FITHDLDEAIRIGHRIAIMKDGAIEQCDTPDQIVLNPATPYVAKFTEEIDHARVVRAHSLVEPGLKAEGTPVDGAATIRSLSRRLIEGTEPALPVALPEGGVGAMPRQAAIDVLLKASG
ncbi:MAG: ABC transporter ATP-binding protein, partial [Pseudomonadota bacterium]